MRVAPAAAAARGDRTRRHRAGVVVRVGLGFGLPSLLYYGLRGLGIGIHPALVVSTLLSVVPALGSRVRHRRVDGLSTTLVVLNVVVTAYHVGCRVHGPDSPLRRGVRLDDDPGT